MKEHKDFLLEAIKESEKSVKVGGFPVGAVVVKNNKIISRGISNGKKLKDPTSHAETSAIRKACKKLNTRNLKDCTLYSSCEPCMMCFFASNWSFIPEIIYACSKEKTPKNYFETSVNIKSIKNKNNLKQKIVHLKLLETQAKLIIDNWEKNI
jgi:guanine deaminase